MKKATIINLLIILILPIASVLSVEFNNDTTRNTINETKPMVAGYASDHNFNYPKKIAEYSGTFDNYIANGFEWTKAPGKWWDTDWNYRKNVTITSDENVVDYPVTFRVKFDPYAYVTSIRVIDEEGNEVPYQLSDLEYHNSTHLVSANISILQL